MKNKLIRVIVTTNFDQLLEKALEKKNIEFDVVTSENDLDNIKPREHSNCRLFKLHGDYKKLNIRNTEKELEKYSDSISKELQEIFDRYGLIVVGYSGSDKAVIEHLINKKSKYSLYWLAREEINEAIQELINHQEGKVIYRDSADTFLKELERKISLFLTYPTGDTPEFLVTHVKNLLREQDKIEINELSKDVVRDLTTKWDGLFEKFRDDHGNRISHLKSLEQILDRLIVIGFVLIEYGENELFNKLLRSFNPIINLSEELIGSRSASIGDMPKMIASELFYLWGSYSLNIENFTAMKLLFDFEISTRDDLVPLFAYRGIHCSDVFNAESSKSFDYLLEYPKDKEYFKDFPEFKKDFHTILCQFNLIIALKIISKRAELKYQFFPNFLRFTGSRIEPLIRKLERNKEFTDTFSHYLFTENPKIFLSKLKERYALIHESSGVVANDPSEWVSIKEKLERIDKSVA